MEFSYDIPEPISTGFEGSKNAVEHLILNDPSFNETCDETVRFLCPGEWNSFKFYSQKDVFTEHYCY